MSHQMMITSVAEGHFHTWMRGAMHTSFNDGHNHSIRVALATANQLGGHTHLLLNQPVKVRF